MRIEIPCGCHVRIDAPISCLYCAALLVCGQIEEEELMLDRPCDTCNEASQSFTVADG